MAQAQFGGPRGPVVVSPEVGADRSVVFRIHAPEAESVGVFTTDMPGGFEPRPMEKGDEGVWELTLEDVDPGTYRYLFNVDGLVVADPRNQAVSESNGNVWSVAHVPGADFMDVLDVPHGAVAEIYYHSPTLERTRRMHVYTPPGYEAGDQDYPVLYLLHGASDSDDSWTTVGRANFILDNLIAAGEAKPMIVVMPAGHTGPFSFWMPTPASEGGSIGNAKFEDEFLNDIVPYVENNYRASADRAGRAIAGLSMGGAQTLNIAASRLDEVAYIGVFSSGVFGITGRGPGAGDGPAWEDEHQDALDDPELKQGLELVWFATGKEDFLIETSRVTVEKLRNHGFDVAFQETSGGHTWSNWRDYLHEFAPQLFQPDADANLPQ